MTGVWSQFVLARPTLGGLHLIAERSKAAYDPLQQRGAVPVAREQRKLAAIVAADVVGYSRLMGRDESGTLVLQSCVVRGPQAGVHQHQLGR
jgi:class 3 adenylate cyclase